MNISPVVCATLALASLASCASRDTAPGQPEPPPAVEHQTELHMKFRIEWREREPFPWTYNGGTVGRVEQYVVYATGFGRRVPDQLKRKPGYFNGYHRLLAVYHVPSRVWTQAEPLFPGTARAYGTY